MTNVLYATDGRSKLETELERLHTENEQLRHALFSRIVIEQAKGILAERHGLSLDAAFFVLRGGSRSSQQRLHDVAAEVVNARATPPCIAAALQRLTS